MMSRKVGIGVASLLISIGVILTVLAWLAPNSTAWQGEPDSDALALASLGTRASEMAREATPNPVLRQVSVAPSGGKKSFMFADFGARKEITVEVSEPTASPNQWQVIVRGEGKLLGHTLAGIDLAALRIGPPAVGRAATSHWPECQVQSVGLVGEGAELNWRVFCVTLEGLVSGTVDNHSGKFEPSAAPPVKVPPTAIPNALEECHYQDITCRQPSRWW